MAWQIDCRQDDFKIVKDHCQDGDVDLASVIWNQMMLGDIKLPSRCLLP